MDSGMRFKGRAVSRREFLKMAGIAGAGITMAGGLGGLLAGCGGAEETTTTVGATTTAAGATTTTAGGTATSLVTKEGDPISFLITSMDNDYYKAWSTGAEESAVALGLKGTIAVNQGQPATEVSQFETDVGKGVKIFHITCPDPSVVPAVAKLANEKKVSLVNTWEANNWETPFQYGEYYAQYLVQDMINASYQLAKYLFESMGGKGRIIEMRGWQGSTPAWQRTLGVEMARAEYPGIELLDWRPGKWNRIDSRAAMEDLITKHGDKIDAVFGLNDDEGIGAMNALEAVGRKGVPIVGLDGNKETLELILEGRYLATVTSFAMWQAGYGAAAAFDHANGYRLSPAERLMHTGSMIIDKTSAQGYLDKFFTEGKPMPLDWKKMSKVLHPDDWDPQNLMWPLDMDKMWRDQPKPAGFEYPAEWVTAKESGELEKVAQMYKDHYKAPIFEGTAI